MTSCSITFDFSRTSPVDFLFFLFLSYFIFSLCVCVCVSLSLSLYLHLNNCNQRILLSVLGAVNSSRWLIAERQKERKRKNCNLPILHWDFPNVMASRCLSDFLQQSSNSIYPFFRRVSAAEREEREIVNISGVRHARARARHLWTAAATTGARIHPIDWDGDKTASVIVSAAEALNWSREFRKRSFVRALLSLLWFIQID